MSDGTLNTAVMDPAEVCRLIKDMREQVDSVSGTLDALRAGLTQLEARVLAMPLPFETQAGDDSVSDASLQPADTYSDEELAATPMASLQPEGDIIPIETEPDAAALGEEDASSQPRAEVTAVEEKADAAPRDEEDAARQHNGEVTAYEAPSDAASRGEDMTALQPEDGAKAIEAQADATTSSQEATAWQPDGASMPFEAASDAAPRGEDMAALQVRDGAKAIEAQADAATSSQDVTAWQPDGAPTPFEAPSDAAPQDEEVGLSQPQSEGSTNEQPDESSVTDSPVDEPSYAGAVSRLEEPVAASSDVAPPEVEPAPEPSWLAASAALDSAWALSADPAEPSTDQAAAPTTAEEAKKPSLTGWPDESIWSPSYDWKPQQPIEAGAAPDAEQPAPAGTTSEIEAPRAQPAPARERYVDNSWLTSSADTSFWPQTPSKRSEMPQDQHAVDAAHTPSSWDGRATAEHGSPTSDEASSPDESGANVDEEAARREDVAQAVARMRAELGYGQPETPSLAASEVQPATRQADEEAARREAVARAVAKLREEIDGAGETDSNAAQDVTDQSEAMALPASEADKPLDEEARREEVRRAVEAARAELSGGPSATMAAPAAPAPGPSRFSLADWTVDQERDGPPVIVIKDSDGRVELAHVYEALNSVSCGDSAALLNYTPHSVTIGLPVRAVIPEEAQMASAFESVFGRPCRVQSDGVRISVSMGADQSAKSEDAA